MRRGLGIGLIVLVLALAIVLVLAARQWGESAQTAIDVQQVLEAPPAGGAAGAPPTPGSAEDLPGLREMKGATGEHTDRLREALEATNQ